VPGELMDRYAMQARNEQLMAEGKAGATVVPMLLGITKGSLETNSWLSASSFQHTIKVLAGAAMEAKEDSLAGLKENVIIGKLIPAGSGFGSNLAKLPEVAEDAGETEMPDALAGELVLEGVVAPPAGMDNLPLAPI
jgi:DNA-directed RNA polymerase subunit beta'